MHTQMPSIFLIGLFLLPATSMFADSDDPTAEVDSLELFRQMYTHYVDSIFAEFDYRTDRVTLGDGLATLQVPAGYSYIGPQDANTLLVDIWGNPPDDTSLGMLVPTKRLTFDSVTFAVDITYVTEGYVDDEDAADIDYDELLEDMQESVEVQNEARAEQGYETVELQGWASEPFYDAERKRLHFAKRLMFEGSEEPTLNYNVQFLNRYGYLQYNVIGGIQDLPEVNARIDDILASVDFAEGQRYADFDSSIDKVAAYGIGGLIAGKLLAKAGLLAKLGLFFAKGWKLILVGIAALFGGIRKLFGGGAKAA